MKIAKVESFLLGADVDTYGFAKGWISKRFVLLVKITTDDGVVGWGETMGYGASGASKVIIDEMIAPGIIGKDPYDKSVIWEEFYDKYHGLHRGGCLTSALAGIDIALWDIIGKATGQPVCKLLGGVQRSKVKAYASALYTKPRPTLIDELVSEAIGYVKEGYKAIKCKMTCDEKTDVEMVRQVRNAIGPDIEYMIDANGAFDPAGAIRFAKKIEQYDMYWFEEPVPPEDIEGYLIVKAHTCIPLAGGEAEYTRFTFRDLISKRAVDFVQPDMNVAGGISEMMKIHTLASAYGVQLMPHFVGSSVALAANLHILATIPYHYSSLNPREPMLEFDRTETPFREYISKEPIVQKGGFVDVPMKPGLGIEVDEAVIKKYLVK